jgi:hypothetical protein
MLKFWEFTFWEFPKQNEIFGNFCKFEYFGKRFQIDLGYNVASEEPVTELCRIFFFSLGMPRFHFWRKQGNEMFTQAGL